MRHRLLLLAALLAFLPASASAIPVRYLFEGSASGDVSGNFFGTTFSIDLIAETDDIVITQPIPTSTVYALEGQGTIAINGIGAGLFLVPTKIASIQSTVAGPRLSFSVDLGPNGIFQALFTLVELDLQGYLLDAPFGPLFEGAPNNVTQTQDVPTSLGELTFSAMQHVTFSATEVPEPSTASLLAAALGLLAWRRRLARAMRLGSPTAG